MTTKKYSRCSCCIGNKYTCSCSGWCSSCSNCNSHCTCSEEEDDTPTGGGDSTSDSTCDDCTKHMHGVGGHEETCYCGATYYVTEYVCDNCDTSQGFFITSSGCSHIDVEV